MSELQTAIYTQSDALPPLDSKSIFHGKTLFRICENTPRMKPYMVVVSDSCGNAVGNMLAVVRYRSTLFPPFIYRHCIVLGEGDYHDDVHKRENVFGLMLRTLMKELGQMLLCVEFGNLGSKMFGYKEFRREGFFPVRWLNVRNSLHSKAPEERLQKRTKARIERAYKHHVTVEEVCTEDDFKAFYRLLHRHNALKPKRYVPDEKFFRGLWQAKDNASLFVTKYKGKVIGCCACSYSDGNAHMWYFAARRKSYALLRPDILTVWHAITDAHSKGIEHFIFTDVGLPFRKSSFRDFVLGFGGKQVSTYRWFRFGTGWLNKLFKAIYK